MFIILKFINDKLCDVLNVVYGQHISLAYTWTTDYLSTEIKGFSLIPANKYEQDIKYIVEISDDMSHKLVKRYKKLNPGYVYNSYSKKNIELYTIKIICFSGNNDIMCKESILYNDLNKEINTKILRSMDKESLYQLFIQIQNIIISKKQFNYTEYNTILSENLKTFRKQFYSSIVKRIKR